MFLTVKIKCVCGEVANVNIEEIVVKNTKTGVAVKDSSTVLAGKVEIQNTDVCVAVYRKNKSLVQLRFWQKQLNVNLRNILQDGSSITLNKSSDMIEKEKNSNFYSVY